MSKNSTVCSHLVGVAVLTYNSAHHLLNCLTPFITSPLRPKILVIDSSSKDNSIEVAKSLGVETIVISQREFNHGLTREMARHRLNTEIVAMVTPDAYAVDQFVLSKLIEPILKGEASVAYARQIPHLKAGFFETFPRFFNYPGQSHIRSLNDLSTYGIYTFFCSNSCAAYSNRALDEIGGFRRVLLGEDTVAVAELLRKGHRVAYVAEAIVRHSHCYGLVEEFQRSFDTGFSRNCYRRLLDCSNNDIARGKAYVKEMCIQLFKKKPYLLPYACFQIFIKWLGYSIGQSSTRAPLWLKKTLSSQKYYWTN